MKFWKSTILRCLCALALACGVSGTAGAVDINAGNLTGTSFVQAYSYAPGQTIHDIFHFDLSAPSSFNAIASEISLPPFFNINDFSLTLTLPGGFAIPFSPTGSVIWTNVLALPLGNDYTLAVSGIVDGSIGGSYSVLMAAAEVVMPSVPEPAHWLLMLVGLAFVSVIAFRRRSRAGRPYTDQAAPHII